MHSATKNSIKVFLFVLFCFVLFLRSLVILKWNILQILYQQCTCRHFLQLRPKFHRKTPLGKGFFVLFCFVFFFSNFGQVILFAKLKSVFLSHFESVDFIVLLIYSFLARLWFLRWTEVCWKFPTEKFFILPGSKWPLRTYGSKK